MLNKKNTIHDEYEKFTKSYHKLSAVDTADHKGL